MKFRKKMEIEFAGIVEYVSFQRHFDLLDMRANYVQSELEMEWNNAFDGMCFCME